MNYNQLIEAYKQLVQNAVGTKDQVNSIDPTDVASIGIELADLLKPILGTINDFNISGGTLPPNNSAGSDLDIYIQGGAQLIFWRKRNGIWSTDTTIDLGIQIVDGNISLQASVFGQVVSVSAGSWGIDNVIYSKPTQTQLNLTPADLNFNRIDSVYANKLNQVVLLDGVASSNPTAPVLPDDTVIVAYVYVPASSSGDLPYIADSNSFPPVGNYLSSERINFNALGFDDVYTITWTTLLRDKFGDTPTVEVYFKTGNTLSKQQVEPILNYGSDGTSLVSISLSPLTSDGVIVLKGVRSGTVDIQGEMAAQLQEQIDELEEKVDALQAEIDSPNFYVVATYPDILPLFTGTKELTFYVTTDNQNMGGKKGAYKYVPGFTTIPAQIAINFND